MGYMLFENNQYNSATNTTMVGRFEGIRHFSSTIKAEKFEEEMEGRQVGIKNSSTGKIQWHGKS